jgi:hypothetical protein
LQAPTISNEFAKIFMKAAGGKGSGWKRVHGGEGNLFCRKKTIKKRKNATKRNGGMLLCGNIFKQQKREKLCPFKSPVAIIV